jgi:hypothetical protein
VRAILHQLLLLPTSDLGYCRHDVPAYSEAAGNAVSRNVVGDESNERASAWDCRGFSAWPVTKQPGRGCIKN